MRFLPLFLLASLPAFAQAPKEIACAQVSYTIECNPYLPTPCPKPPVHAPLVFVTAPIDDRTQQGWLKKDTDFENFPLSLYVTASYSTDGTNVSPALEMTLTDAYGISASSRSEPGLGTTALKMERSKKLSNMRISTTTVLIRCSLD